FAARTGNVAPEEADVAEVVVRRGRARVESERGLERLLGLLHPAHLEERERPIVVRADQARIERERPIERGERLAIPLLVPVELAEVVERHRPLEVVVREFEDVLIRGLRLLVVAGLLVRLERPGKAPIPSSAPRCGNVRTLATLSVR